MEKKYIPVKLYKKIHACMPIACVDVVIVNSKKEFLLTKRSNKPVKGYWWLPGGRVIKGETLKKCAIRKAKEEAGIKIHSIKYLGIDETMFKDGPFGQPTHTINVTFLAKTKGDNQALEMDSQSCEARWFSKIEKDWHPYIKKTLKLAGFK